MSGTETVAFAYGPDRQRWQQNYNSGTEVTNYIGGLLEQVGSSAGTTWRHYIYAGREPVAVYSRTSTLVNTWSYFYTDHLGSIAGIANSSGVSDVAEAFTAFGARRNPTTWSGAPSSGDLSTIAGLSRQGYTFQTALGQSMGLNHMNGRVQDAITGRFLSADPNIPNPRNPQSYNRFSYVQNNPLTFVDPSGFLDDEPTLPEVTVPGVSIAPDGSDLLPQVTVPGTPLAPDGSDLLPQVTVPGTPLPGDSGLLPQVVVTPPPPPPGKSSPKGAVPGLPQHTKPSACVNPVVRVAQAVVGAAQVGYGLVQAIDGVLDVGAGIGGALETGGGSAALLIPIGAANVTLGSAAIGDGAMLLGAAMSGSGNAPTMFGLVGQRYGGESGAQTGEFANLAGQLASWAMSPPTSAQSAIINAGLMVLSDILPDAGTIGGQQCQNP